MPPKGFKSITIPDPVFNLLKIRAKDYGITYQKLIETYLLESTLYDPVISKKHKNKKGPLTRLLFSDDSFNGGLIGLTVISSNFEDFRTWLLTRRNVSEETAHRYIQEIDRLRPTIQPQDFLTDYVPWTFNAVRVYVQFLYQFGLLDLEQKDRWLSLIQIKKRDDPGEPMEINPQDLGRAIRDTPDQYRPIVDLLYYSGIRIIEALAILNRKYKIKVTPIQGDCLRLTVNMTRGSKRCNYVYCPKGLKFFPLSTPADHLSRELGYQAKVFRKFFYRVAKETALENKEDPMLADFYQSRVSAYTIGATHYGNMVQDADRLYPLIVKNLKAVG